MKYFLWTIWGVAFVGLLACVVFDILSWSHRRKNRPAPLRPVADKYFKEHPEEKDGVMKAYYAYHAPHPRLDLQAHNFSNGSRESRCAWCGRSREEVRHDGIPARCQFRPLLGSIAGVIKSEEERAEELFDSAKEKVPALVEKMGMSGATLALLHQTYGWDPEIVAAMVPIPPLEIVKYEMERQKARDLSKAAQKKDEILVVKSAEPSHSSS